MKIRDIPLGVLYQHCKDKPRKVPFTMELLLLALGEFLDRDACELGLKYEMQKKQKMQERQ